MRAMMSERAGRSEKAQAVQATWDRDYPLDGAARAEMVGWSLAEATRILAETEPDAPNCGIYGCGKHGTSYMWPGAAAADALIESIANVLPVLDEMEADARKEAR